MAAESTRYDAVAIALHWTIAALIIANIALAWSLGAFQKDDPLVHPLLSLHKSIGVTVLGLTLARLIWRAGHPAPALPVGFPDWQRRVSRVVHALLYVCLFVMPISGWIDSAAFTQPIDFFFLFSIPPFLAHDEALGHAVFAVHETTATLLYALIVVHAGASLLHHYVLKDRILRRMLPGKV